MTTPISELSQQVEKETMTPEEINNKVEKILDYLNAEVEPIYLEVKPESSTDISDCFRIVEKKVKECGGRIVYGWTIWEHKYFIEAECHAVWENTNQEYNDITPKQKNIKQILFAEDDKIKYEGKQIPNIRLNTSKHPLVDDLIATCDALFRLQNRGERAFMYDLSKILTNDELQEINEVAELKNMILYLLNLDGNRDNLCLCKSGKKFKNCCGKDLIKRMKIIR